MNILFITIAWPAQGERNLYSDLMDEFVLHGHRVFVIAAGNSEEILKAEITKENGINLLRINSGKIRKVPYLRKALSLLLLNDKLYKAIKSSFRDMRFELIISHTPPITLSSLYYRLKNLYNAPLYLLLKDIWPQGSVDLKVFRKFGLIWIFLRYHEVRIYNVADYIGTMSPMNADYLINKNKFLSKQKVEVCPNSIRPSNKSLLSGNEAIRKKYSIPADSCVFILSGNLARGHGLSFLINAIKQLNDYHKAFFIVGGSGTHYTFVKEAFDNCDSKNVFIYKWLPPEDFKLILGTSDVGLILLERDYTIPQFPSRLLSYIDAGKPVLCAVNKDTDIGTILESSSCGRSVIHGDLTAFINEIKFLSENKKIRLQMGENARKLLFDQYSVSKSYKIIMKHFLDLDSNKEYKCR